MDIVDCFAYNTHLDLAIQQGYPPKNLDVAYCVFARQLFDGVSRKRFLYATIGTL